jgi:hypothetical protein
VSDVPIPVRGIVAFADERNRSFPRTDVSGVTLVGIDQLRDVIERAPGHLDRRAIERTLVALLTTLAQPEQPKSAEELAAARKAVKGKSVLGMSFEQFVRTWYLRPWTSGSASRLYLKDTDGTDVGWKDLRSGVVTVHEEGDCRLLAAALLQGASKAALSLDASLIPRVPIKMLGSRLVGRVSYSYWSVLLGHEWRGKGLHRLYGRLLDPIEGHFELGYVDLASNEVVAKSTESLAKNLGVPDRYLTRLLGSWHPEEWAQRR